MDTPVQIPQGYQPPTTPDAPATPTTTTAPAPSPFAPPATTTPSFLAPQQPHTVTHTPGANLPSAYHQNVQRGGFDDDVKTGDYDSYKGVQGRMDRLAFLAPRDNAWGRTHYVDKGEIKGFFLCDSKFEKQGGQEVIQHLAACCQKLGPPKKRFAAPIIQYTTDAKGTVLQPFSYALKIWRFNEILFDQIRTLSRQFPLEHSDLWAKCTDSTYWKYEITPMRECILTHPEFRSSPDPSGSGLSNGQIIDSYVAAMSPRLDRMTGRAATPQEWAEIMAALGGFTQPSFPGGTVVSGPGDQPISTIADLLGGKR